MIAYFVTAYFIELTLAFGEASVTLAFRHGPPGGHGVQLRRHEQRTVGDLAPHRLAADSSPMESV